MGDGGGFRAQLFLPLPPQPSAPTLALAPGIRVATCKVSADLCPVPPEGDVRGLGLTVSAPLLPKTPGRFLMELEFAATVPA